MAVQNALEEGKLVKNRYEIQKILTLGGNKIIYEAYDCDQGRNISLRECFLMNVCCRFPDQTMIHVPRNKEQKLANVNHFFTLLGKMFFTPYGKEFFTYLGKQIFTS